MADDTFLEGCPDCGKDSLAHDELADEPYCTDRFCGWRP